MIEENDIEQIKAAVSRLEQKNRRLHWGCCALLILSAATFASFAAIEKTTARTEIAPDTVLRVRGLIVVDD